MNSGKTLFAQIMEFMPWTSFSRIVARYSGDARVSTLPCTEHFRIMAYAQLTWRESLRDIEATLGANATKLYGMGLRQAVRRSTLADANERRDWRIWADLAAVLIRRANKLYADEPLGLDVNVAGKVYALDSSTIDLCLSLFGWAPFRTTKAAIKLHTLLDLRGSIPSFIHISDGKMGDVNVLDILPLEAGAFYIMDRGYLDFARLYTMHQAGAFFVTRAKSNFNARRVYSAKVDKATGVVCDQSVALNGFKAAKDYPEHLRRVRFKDPMGKTLIFLTNNTALPAPVIAQLYKNRWQVDICQSYNILKTQSANDRWFLRILRFAVTAAAPNLAWWHESAKADGTGSSHGVPAARHDEAMRTGLAAAYRASGRVPTASIHRFASRPSQPVSSSWYAAPFSSSRPQPSVH